MAGQAATPDPREIAASLRCAYCDYPLNWSHKGATEGAEQCPVCGADEPSQLQARAEHVAASKWMNGGRRKLLIAWVGGAELPGYRNPRRYDLNDMVVAGLMTPDGPTQLGRAVAAILAEGMVGR